MRNHQGIANPNPISRVFKWVMALIIACLFMASAVCRAQPIDTNTTDIDPSALPTEQSPDFIPQDNPFLSTNGECQVPATVPLPAALWAGLAGGAIVLGRDRRARRRW